MDFEDVVEPQVAAAVAITAALVSPRVRGWLRKGAVYGIAGALIAGDAVMSFGRGVAERPADGSVHDAGRPAAVVTSSGEREHRI